MKKVFLSSVVILFCILIHAQVPESFNYQAIVRNAAGEPVIAQQVTFLFTVYKTSPGGTNVYSEKHTPTTNEFGLVTLAIGTGTDKTGDFSSIDWGNDNYFLNVQIDPAGGESYTDMGTTQLVSVPYALYAEEVETVDGSFFYRDKDGDGFGYMYESVWVPDGTDPPEHYVDNDGDCNDDDYFTQTGSTEVCDGADNDCDGVIDNGFCDENGIYNTDVACGNCYTDCQTIYDLPNAYGECDDSGPVPVCVMQCDEGYYDRDGIPQNGCEFYLDEDAIYVSPEGDDVEGCGTDIGSDACSSITFGISEADRLGRSSVLVANGLYDEAVIVEPGINLLGGYNPVTWSRNVENTLTVISGSSNIGGDHLYTIKADGIVQSTTISGFIIQGAINFYTSGNSYVVYINNSDGNLMIVDNLIYAGKAGDGAEGSIGADGEDGNPGGVGANTEETYSWTNIFDVAGGAGGAGGISGASGGDGGGVHGQVTLNDQQESGEAGSPGGGGVGGDGGYNRYSDNCGTFATGGYSAQAQPGEDGVAGLDGSGGTGGTDATGTVISSHWRGEDGSPGGNGTHGSGGGGGGAGGGADVTINCSGVDDCSGGTGGGGGSGAEGGHGGTKGESGGGSFCVFMINSTSPVLENNDFYLGSGGKGGDGGFGGTKGMGGAGGMGGQVSGPWSFVLGMGGNGGKGGDGGHGGGGGGGTGGCSFGIYTYNTTVTTDYEIDCNNTFSGGMTGNGGSKGLSYGEPGQDGADGVVENCSYN